MIIPIAPVHGSTGSANLAYVNAVPTVTTVTQATNNESVVAGTSIVTAQDGAAATGTFAINFTGVTFSGTQFKLYISTNGFSNIGAGDLLYTPTSFNTASFATYDCTTACKAVTESVPGVGSSTFYIGHVGASDIVAGPIDLQINSSYNFIKVYDGSTGAVAVTTGTLYPQPGITLSKTSGPAGTMVSVNGGAFPSNTKLNLNASFAYQKWSSATNSTYNKIWMSGVSTGPGYFTTSALPMVDTMQSIDTQNSVITGIWITVVAAYTNGTVANKAQNALSQPRFHESSRGLFEIYSYDSAGTIISSANAFTSGVLFGNDSGNVGTVGTTTVSNAAVVDARIFGTLGIEGNFSYVGKSVTFLVGGANAGVATSSAMSTTSSVVAGSDGQWIANVTIPILGLGDHNVWVDMGGVYYNFTINVLPTIVLKDSVTGGATGPASNPSSTVTVTGYGLPSNDLIYIFWNIEAWGYQTAFNLVNGTTGSNGQFNETVQFTVPESYGVLPHNVTAVDSAGSYAGLAAPTYLTDTVANVLPYTIASENFTITPTISITPSTTNANSADNIVVTLEGLAPGCFDSSSHFSECEYFQGELNDSGLSSVMPWYTVSLDNVPMGLTGGPGYWYPMGGASGAMASGWGTMYINFTAAGLRPGIHVISLTNHPSAGSQGYEGYNNFYSPSSYHYAPNIVGFFNVTTTGDSIYAGFSSLQTTVNALSTSVASMQASLASMSTDISTLSSDVAALTSSVSALQTSVSSISSKVNSISSSLSSISSSITSMQSSLSTLSSDISTLTSSVATLTSDVGTLQTSVSSITSQLNTIASQVSSAASSASSAASAAQQASTAASQAASNTSGISNTSTYVLVVAVLAAITLVLELAILVRKLS